MKCHAGAGRTAGSRKPASGDSFIDGGPQRSSEGQGPVPVAPSRYEIPGAVLNAWLPRRQISRMMPSGSPRITASTAPPERASTGLAVTWVPKTAVIVCADAALMMPATARSVASVGVAVLQMAKSTAFDWKITWRSDGVMPRWGQSKT